ncbi:MAG: hypothetical protein AABW88_02425 [Nanoarchaeota archaeon]
MDGLGKKGFAEQLQAETIMELVLAGIITVALFVYVSNVASNSLFEQNFMARDVGLLTDTILSAPGNVNYVYDTSIAEKKIPGQEYTPLKFFHETKFSFLFRDSTVSVFSTDSSLETPVEYYFGTDSNIKFDSTDKLKYNLVFNKVSNELKITSIEQVATEEEDE